MRTFAGLLLALCSLIPAQGILGEVLLLDVIAQEPANSPDGLLRPQRGTQMGQVVVRFGEPMERFVSVGDPPITRWVYPGYTVYFEHDQVLASVVHR